LEDLKGRDCLSDVIVDGRIILEQFKDVDSAGSR
jgi:hypothetical protein